MTKVYNKAVIEKRQRSWKTLTARTALRSKHAYDPSSHETIICLPPELVVEITGGDVSDVDIITQ